jgi:putative Holliday junction resolvase
MKILGIDFGTKKVGLAFADMNIRIAMPGDIIYYSQKKELIEKIKKIIHEKEVEEIVIGLPLSLDFQETEISQKAREFGKILEAEINLPVDFQNEIFTTKQAESTDFESRRKIKSRKPIVIRDVDNQSATLILESYLAKKS